jgi:hypothetical protein
MKVSFPKSDKDLSNNGKSTVENILPLKFEKARKLSKDQMVTFKLRTSPANADSTTYEFTVPILHGDEGVRPAIEWAKKIHTVCIGMNANTAEEKKNLYQRTLKGEVKAIFDNGYFKRQEVLWHNARELAGEAAAAAGNNPDQVAAAMAAVPRPDADDTCVDQGMHEVLIHMTPYKVLARVKRQLRRHSRKPADMTVNEYFTAIQRINCEELPLLPPQFDDTQCLTDEELTEIIYFGIPNSWKMEMVKQGFDPLEHTLAEFREFCQRLEDIPDFQPTNHKNGKASSNSSSKKPKTETNSKSKTGGSKYCLVHGKGGHDSNECHTLKRMVKDETDGGSKNKSWSRKADDYKKKQSKELAAFIKKSVKAELNAFSDKKRKSDSDDSDGEEVNHFDASELNAINFEDINLSDDEFHDAKEEGDDDSTE